MSQGSWIKESRKINHRKANRKQTLAKTASGETGIQRGLFPVDGRCDPPGDHWGSGIEMCLPVAFYIMSLLGWVSLYISKQNKPPAFMKLRPSGRQTDRKLVGNQTIQCVHWCPVLEQENREGWQEVVSNGVTKEGLTERGRHEQRPQGVEETTVRIQEEELAEGTARAEGDGDSGWERWSS